jgi:hypothetical protein
MADPSASIWEVTQLILGDPTASPHEIAQAHGFSMAEIAEMLPIVVENLQADFSPASVTAANGAAVRSPEPLPGETAEEYAARWLTELRQSDDLDLASYDSLDPASTDAEWLDALPEPGELPEDPAGLDDPAGAADLDLARPPGEPVTTAGEGGFGFGRPAADIGSAPALADGDGHGDIPGRSGVGLETDDPFAAEVGVDGEPVTEHSSVDHPAVDHPVADHPPADEPGDGDLDFG